MRPDYLNYTGANKSPSSRPVTLSFFAGLEDVFARSDSRGTSGGAGDGNDEYYSRAAGQTRRLSRNDFGYLEFVLGM